MVHLEVTGKENTALCITNRDGDKLTGALRDLDKGLFTHVRNWIHFLEEFRGVPMPPWSDKRAIRSSVPPKVRA